jgi:hypothetical protein
MSSSNAELPSGPGIPVLLMTAPSFFNAIISGVSPSNAG